MARSSTSHSLIQAGKTSQPSRGRLLVPAAVPVCGALRGSGGAAPARSGPSTEQPQHGAAPTSAPVTPAPVAAESSARPRIHRNDPRRGKRRAPLCLRMSNTQ